MKLQNLILTSLLVFLAAPHSFAVSTRYEKATAFPDGSVLIEKPRFAAPNGQILPLSETSDLDGVCRLYGYRERVKVAKAFEKYPAYKKDQAYVYDGENHSVVIDNHGVFGGLATSRVISFIGCTHGQSGPVLQKGLKAFKNDDGVTVSISNIKYSFAYYKDMNVLLLENTNLDFICKQAGRDLKMNISKAIKSSATYKVVGRDDGDYIFKCMDVTTTSEGLFTARADCTEERNREHFGYNLSEAHLGVLTGVVCR